MRAVFGIIALLVCSEFVHGAEPPIFVLRAEGLQQGIVRIDPESGVETRLADFIYASHNDGANGQLTLTALSDRIVGQGTVFYEFDASSGQLLRRYSALAPGFDTWAFRGVAVDATASKRLGIPAGFYGTVICPYLVGATGAGCGVPPRESNGAQHVFLRRGLDPADTTLSVAKLFTPTPAGAGFAERFPAVDIHGRRFLFLNQGSVSNGLLQRLTAAPVDQNTIGEESVLREDLFNSSNSNRVNGVRAFAFDEVRSSFFLSRFFPGAKSELRLVQETLDGHSRTLKSVEQVEYSSIAASSVTEPEVYTQIVPAVGDAAGANGTYWRSDAWFFNPSDEPSEVRVERVSRPGNVYTFTLAPHASKKIDNVLRELGGGPAGDGTPTDALITHSNYRKDRQVSVVSRSYTTAAGGGTYGQGIQAVPSVIGYSNHLAPTTNDMYLAETSPTFVLDKRVPNQYRHNLGVVNTSDDPLSITLGLLVLTVPPHAMRQYNIESLFSQEPYSPSEFTVSGSKPAALWLSMIDNRTGDASFIPFALYGVEAGPAARLAVPAIAHTPGANGTFWRTDAYGVFSARAIAKKAQHPEVNFYSTDPRCGQATQQLNPTSGWDTTFTDIVREVCPGAPEAFGALAVQTGSWMSMVSRTYTTREDGGTYGEILPLYPPRGYPSRHFGGIEVHPTKRVNIGLYNGSDAASQVSATLYDQTGSVQAKVVVQITPRVTIQRSIRDLFGADIPDGTYGISFVSIEGIGCWPYVTTVDNVTGDPTNWW